jgi:triosephosphate isomerase
LFLKFGRRVARQTPILYGGSVNAQNALDFFEKGEANGLLVGRASWNASSFIDLLKQIE